MAVHNRISQRVLAAMFRSIGAGVTPRLGLEHLVVGREREREALLDDLDVVADGGTMFRILAGRFGDGKSFLLQLLRGYATDQGFVVADAALSPNHRLTGSKGEGLATYRELLNNIATKARPDGAALSVLFERWINKVQSTVAAELKLSPEQPELIEETEARIRTITNDLQNAVHGFDFATVVNAYWRGFRESNDELQADALRWLRGEYSSKLEARKALGVREIITDENWYDYIKLFSEFFVQIGYKGLIVLIDEAVNLYKIPNTIGRKYNYEMILNILNDTLQGGVDHFGVVFATTSDAINDSQRGLFSYEALRSRLAPSRFQQENVINMAAPIITLQKLSNDELLILLQKVRALHGSRFKYEPALSDEDLAHFLQVELSRVGAEELITPRDVLRDFVAIIDTLRQDPSLTLHDILDQEYKPSVSTDQDGVDADTEGLFTTISL